MRCEASVTPNQVSTFSNIYRHTSPLLTLYHLIPNITNLYWQNTSQYRHILTLYHQVPLIIHYLVRRSTANWIISLFTTHLMSHADYTWSSFLIPLTKNICGPPTSKSTGRKLAVLNRFHISEFFDDIRRQRLDRGRMWIWFTEMRRVPWAHML